MLLLENFTFNQITYILNLNLLFNFYSQAFLIILGLIVLFRFNDFVLKLLYLTLAILSVSKITLIPGLANGLIKIHPFLIFSSFLLFFKTRAPQLIFTGFFLGGFWAMNEFNWGRWWSWDYIEMFPALLSLYYLYLMHKMVKLNLFIRNIYLLYWGFLFCFFLKNPLLTSIHSFTKLFCWWYFSSFCHENFHLFFKSIQTFQLFKLISLYIIYGVLLRARFVKSNILLKKRWFTHLVAKTYLTYLFYINYIYTVGSSSSKLSKLSLTSNSALFKLLFSEPTWGKLLVIPYSSLLYIKPSPHHYFTAF